MRIFFIQNPDLNQFVDVDQCLNLSCDVECFAYGEWYE
jgi:hypothetical protein